MSEQRGALEDGTPKRKKKRRRKRSSAVRESVGIGELSVRPRSDGKLFAALALACVGAGLFAEPMLRFFLGFGGFGLGFFSLHRQGAMGGVVVGANLHSDGLVSLTMANGELINLPASSFARISKETRVTQTSSDNRTTRTRHVVVVHKRDGGAFEVASFGDDAAAAKDAAKRFGEALAALPARDAALYEPTDVLRELPGVSVATTAERTRGRAGESADETLEVHWSAAWPWPSAAAFMITVASVALASTAMPDETHLFTGFLCLFGLLTAAMFVRSFGSVAVVRLDRDALTLERRWHGRTMASREIPLGEVAALELVGMGSGNSELLVRRLEDPTAVEVADEIKSGGPLALVRNILRMTRERQTLPRGGLSQGDYMLLDLALSAEIARRKGVDPDLV